MKKTIVAIMALVMALTMAACGGDNGSSAANASSTAGTSSAAGTSSTVSE